MTTIKSYTDVAQSKTLSNILPFESADGTWVERTNLEVKYSHSEIPFWLYGGLGLPSWSLAALLDVIPKYTDLCKSSSNENKDIIAYWCYNFPNNLTTECYDNPVDACVAMIEKLHELKML